MTSFTGLFNDSPKYKLMASYQSKGQKSGLKKAYTDAVQYNCSNDLIY